MLRRKRFTVMGGKVNSKKLVIAHSYGLSCIRKEKENIDEVRVEMLAVAEQVGI